MVREGGGAASGQQIKSYKGKHGAVHGSPRSFTRELGETRLDLLSHPILLGNPVISMVDGKKERENAINSFGGGGRLNAASRNFEEFSLSLLLLLVLLLRRQLHPSRKIALSSFITRSNGYFVRPPDQRSRSHRPSVRDHRVGVNSYSFRNGTHHTKESRPPTQQEPL